MSCLMRKKINIKVLEGLLVIVLIHAFGLAQQPFVCGGDFFICLTPSSNSSFYRIIYNGTTVSFNNFTGNSTDRLNSIGYRSTDNFIYGVNPNNLRLYRIDAQGNTTLVTQLTGAPSNTVYYAGDITPDGRTMVLIGGRQGQSNTDLLRIDLTDPNYPVTQVSLVLVGGGANNTRVADIAFDPTTGILYAFDFDAGQLLTIDQRTGIVDNQRFAALPSAILFGALFFDEFGELFGYGRSGSSGDQREFYSINKRTGTANLLAIGPGASGNDGCSCPYRVAAQLNIEPRIALACDTLTYTLRITNSSGTNRVGVDLDIPLPAGFVGINVSRNPLGVAPSGLGTSLISFRNATIPLGIDSVVLEVVVPGHASFATYSSQASISSLPISLGGTVTSDDPGTISPNDPTEITLLSDTVDLGTRTVAYCIGDSVLVDRRRQNGIYQWSDGPQTGARYFTQAGTYSLITDDDCLYYIEEIVVTENPLPIINTGNVPDICSGQSVNLFVTGGTSYQWNPTPYLSNTSTNNPIATPPSTTTFIVTGTDENGCSNIDSVEVVVRPSPVVDAGLDRTVCAGDTITIGSSSIAGQIYVWNQAPGITDVFAAQTQYVVPYSNSAELILRVTGPFRCEKYDTLRLTINALEGQSQVEDILCFGENTGAISTLWQGATPIAYQWNLAGSPTVFQQLSMNLSDTLSPLDAGTYYGFATDANGCRWWDTVAIDQPASALDLQVLNLQGVDCFGNQNGELSVLANGGTAPYQYAFDGGPFDSNTIYPNLGARPYQTVAIDDNGCTDTLDVLIESPTGLAATIDALAQPRCFGDTNGWVQFDAQGGQTPYAWSLDGANFSAQSRWNGFAAGTQTFFLRDDNGCLVSVPVTFRDPVPIALDTIEVVRPICFGDANGEVSLTASGGTGIYLYGADGLNYSNDSLITGLNAGSYLFQVVDDSMCRDTFPFELTEPPLLDVSVMDEDVRCFGETNGRAVLDVRGGTPPFDAIWETEPTQQGAIAEELPAGGWLAIVTDRNGCTDSIIAVIEEPEQLILALVDTLGAFCEFQNGQGEATATGGIAPYRLLWQGRDTLEGFVQTTLWGGEYRLLLEDANGCQDSLDFELSDPPAPIAAIETEPAYGDSLVWDERDPVVFVNASQYALFYTWDFGDGSGVVDFAPIHQYQNPGSYPVTLIAFDERNACPDTALLNLKLVPPGAVFLPNAFSPNNDGINDYLKLPGEGLSQVDIRIYNRWGREIQFLNSLQPGWDGRDTSGKPVPEGVYVIQVRALANDGTRVNRVSTVTLVR